MIRVIVTQPGQDQRVFVHPAEPLEFGRGPGRNQVTRCQVQDRYVSKNHLRALEKPDGRVELENLSSTNPVRVEDQPPLGVGERREFALPVLVMLGEAKVSFVPEQDSTSLGTSDLEPGVMLKTIQRSMVFGDPTKSEPFLNMRDSMTPERLVRWFETVVAVQRAAAGSPEFYGQTARALVELVGLDRGLVLLRQDDEWVEVARHGTEPTGSRAYSRGVMRSVLEKRATCYKTFDESSLTGSHHWVDEIIASPVFDARDEIVGALYGSRDVSRAKVGANLGELEAQVVQVLAAAVATGLARLEQEAEATRSRVQFEQFFTPELASRLGEDPHLLEAQEREITVLFADMRGFTRLSERLNPTETYSLIGELMELVTARIRAHEGVVVDYAGDGLLAMWNAPTDQPDHAERACRAALEMADVLPDVNKKWRAALGGEIGLGIGINTGKALVGNTGTRYKFKYGPRGSTVNLGSRVEGATKYLGVPILISQTTRMDLGPTFGTRRLGRVRLVGVGEPADLHELHAEQPTEAWRARRDAFEAALSYYERGRFADACKTLYPLLAAPEGQEDMPSLTLIARAVEQLKSQGATFDPVLELSGK